MAIWGDTEERNDHNTSSPSSTFHGCLRSASTFNCEWRLSQHEFSYDGNLTFRLKALKKILTGLLSILLTFANDPFPIPIFPPVIMVLVVVVAASAYYRLSNRFYLNFYKIQVQQFYLLMFVMVAWQGRLVLRKCGKIVHVSSSLPHRVVSLRHWGFLAVSIRHSNRGYDDVFFAKWRWAAKEMVSCLYLIRYLYFNWGKIYLSFSSSTSSSTTSCR